MASTNKTSNYELSQFLGTDKPAWLSDYNGDMNKIDAQMKLNADAATAAGGAASSATSAIGTLASLTTEAKSNLVAAINEVDNNTDTAAGVADSAYTVANTADTKASGLQTYLTLTQFTNLTVSRTAGSGVEVTTSTLKAAVNAAGSLGRIYGKIELNFIGGGSNTITISDTKFRPSEQFNVNGFALAFGKGTGETNYSSVTDKTITFNTDGTVTFDVSGSSGDKATIIFQTGLIFAEDFGD